MIPKEWEGKDFYQILGISTYARFEEIKAAHRRLVRAFHPDLAPHEDSADKFRAVTLAYEVLGNATLRAQYDQHFFSDYSKVKSELYTKRRPYTRLLIRAALFVLILLLLKNLGFIGNTTIIQNSGSSQTINSSGGSNNNQVLALMAGPQGPPGPAGIAGRDGFIGLNGYQGKDGLPGAPGAVGQAGANGAAGAAGAQGKQGIQGIQGLQGESVTVEPIAEDEEDCGGLGGVRLIGTTTAIVCNGSSGGGSGVIGTGYVNVGACDSNVKISLESTFKNGEFRLSGINVGEVSGLCDNQELTAILKIRSTFPPDGLIRNHYLAGDAIRCRKNLDLDPTSGLDANNIQLGLLECRNITTPNDDFELDDVFAYDVSASPRALLIQIVAK